MTSPRDAAPRDGLVDRLVEVCAADPRIVALFEGGSRARGEADERSDIDVTVLIADDALDEILAGKDGFVRAIGDAPFAEDFGIKHMAFVIFDDGTELEIHFYRRSDLDSIHAGPHRVLLDPHGLLAGKIFPAEEPDPVARSRHLRA